MLTTFDEPACAPFSEENHALNSAWLEIIGAATAFVAAAGACAVASSVAGFSAPPVPTALTTGATLPLCAFTVS